MRTFFTSLLLLVLMGCSNETQKSGLDITELQLYVGSSKQLTYYGGECQWSSDNPLIASVNDGLVKGVLAGETYVYANSNVCHVEIIPYTSYFLEVYKYIAMPYANIENFLVNSGCKCKDSSVNSGMYTDNNGTLYTYIVEDYNVIGATMQTHLGNSSTLGDYMAERFLITDEKDNIIYFVDPTRTIVCGVTINFDYKPEYRLMAVFVPASTRSSVEESIELCKSILNNEHTSLPIH